MSITPVLTATVEEKGHKVDIEGFALSSFQIYQANFLSTYAEVFYGEGLAVSSHQI